MLASVTYICIVQGKGSEYIPETIETQSYQTSPEGMQMNINKSELLCCGPYALKGLTHLRFCLSTPSVRLAQHCHRLLHHIASSELERNYTNH